MASDASNPDLIAIIRAEIAAAGGKITFARFMDLALYHPNHGYYQSPTRRPGRGGDFLTAPETTPHFGLTIARQLLECWERLGEPDPFTIREYGAGIGGFAYDLIVGLLTLRPELRPALDYRLVERNPHRVAQALAAMDQVGLADVVTAEDAETSTLSPITGVVLANEVADALPVHRLIVQDGEFVEGFVTWREGLEPGFVESIGPVSSPELGQPVWDRLAAAGVTLQDGDRVDTSPATSAWFQSVASGLARGYALIIDYGYATEKLYRDHRLQGTLRGYYQHTATDDPFAHVGEQDLTAHVDFSALITAGETAGLTLAGLTNQAAFLSSLGLGRVLVDLQQEPEVTTQEYLATRAAIFRLIDPGGMGRFGVLLMARNAPISPPLRGLTELAVF